MTSAMPPQNEHGQPSPQADNRDDDKRSAPVPFYRRSLFWLLIGMLIGLAVLLLLFTCQKVTPVVSTAANATDPRMEELLELQRAHNSGLEEEVRRLQALMQEDPCALPALMGESPERAPLAPGYGSGSPAPGAEKPQEGRPPSLPTLPQSNSTAKPAPSANGTAAPVSSLPPPSTVGELMDQATVFILSMYQNKAGLGSGFFVAPGIIATNSHVAQSPDAQIFVGNKALGGMQPATVIAFSHDEARDYALLQVSGAVAAKAPVLQLASGAKRTEKVSAWGFPGYIMEIDPKLQALAKGDSQAVPEVVYSEGVVSVVLDRKPQVILHTASISQGNSGGPLVDAQGVVVGINTFIKKADKSYSQTNIALPGGDLAQFMKEHGVQAPSLAR